MAATSPADPRQRLVAADVELRSDSDLVAVGKLGRVWGVNGGLNVQLYNPDSRLEWADEVIWVRGEGFPVRPVRVAGWEEKGARLLLHFEGVRQREAAASLTHLELLVPGDWLDEPADDEFYVHELIGMRVIDELRGELGDIHHVFNSGSTDVYVVGRGRREVMIPAVKDFVLSVDREERIVRVRYEEL